MSSPIYSSTSSGSVDSYSTPSCGSASGSSSYGSTSSTRTTSREYADARISVCALCEVLYADGIWAPHVSTCYSYNDSSKKPFGLVLKVESTGKKVRFFKNCDYKLRFNGTDIEFTKSPHMHKDKETIDKEQLERYEKLLAQKNSQK